MRYTKYKYKKNNDGLKLLISVILTITIAIIIGNLGARWIIRIIPENFKVKSDNITQVEEETPQGDYNEVTYSIIQCGYFSKIENANNVLAKLSDYNNAFIYADESGKFRVIADLVEEKDTQEVLSKLQARGIESTKIDYVLKEGDNSEGYILAIVQGQFEIINTFEDETVKEIEILEFKEWVNSLELSAQTINNDEVVKEETDEEILKNTEIDLVLENYKQYIINLPDKVERENVKEYIKNLYSVVINFKK